MTTDMVEKKLIAMRDRVLREAARIAQDKDMQPHDGKTFCNMALARYAAMWKNHQMIGLLANQISTLCFHSPDWKTANPEDAQTAAMECKLVVAHQPGYPHGHVAAVLPLPLDKGILLTWRTLKLLSMGRTTGAGIYAGRCFHNPPLLAIWTPPDGDFPS